MAVSHFRLAAHLSLAVLIFSYLLWIAFSLKNTKPIQSSFCLKHHGWITLLFVSITIIWGAFVAGLDAGLVYNTWPMMGEQWIPTELNSFIAILIDPVSVQFTHRWIAIITGLLVLGFAYRIKSFALFGIVLVQIALGVITLLSQVSIPLAALHQAGAPILVARIIYNLQRIMQK